MNQRRQKNVVGHFIRRYKLASAGGLIVVMFVLTGLTAPWIAPMDPTRIAVRDSVRPPGGEYLLGADQHGRDMLSRIIFGARISLLISFSSVALGALFGVSLGMVAGWWRTVEPPVMRFMDVLLCFPGIIIALTVISVLGSGLENVIFAIVMGQVPQFARLAHGLTETTKRNTYVDAAVSIGASDLRILSRHLFPNILAPIIVQMSLAIPGTIMTAAALSFLGLGVPPPTPEWGAMLQDSLHWARMGPHIVVFPGLTLMLVVFGFNLFGDGLRSALDPRAS